MSSWGIKDISIRLTTFTGDGFRLDFEPIGRNPAFLRGTSGIFNSYIRASLFQLDLNTGLTGELLIFYSYLKDVSKTYNGEINTRKFVIEERMNTTKIAVKKLLLKLYARGLAEKIEKYKLTIL